VRREYKLRHDVMFLCVSISDNLVEFDDGDGGQEEIPCESVEDGKQKAVAYIGEMINKLEEFRQEILK